MNITYVMYAIFALAVGSMLYRIVKHRGFRGALFGAPVRSTVAELELQARGMVKTRLKVYQLDGHTTNNDIGLEIVHTTVGSWQAVPVSLTAAEARQLAEALELAARESEAFVAAG